MSSVNNFTVAIRIKPNLPSKSDEIYESYEALKFINQKQVSKRFIIYRKRFLRE